MVVYVEYLFVDNLVINYCLLSLCCKVLKVETSKKRLLLASTIGALGCFVYSFLASDILIVNLFKIALAFTMLKISIKKMRIRQFIFAFLILLLLTYLLGAILTKLYSTMNVNFGFAFQPILPIGVSIAICLAYSKVLQCILLSLNKKHKKQTFVYKTTFEYNGKSITENCFLDSGNCLTDSIDNQPITIINYELLFKLTNIDAVSLIKKQTNLKNAHYQKIATLSGESEMLIFQIDKLEIQNEQNIQILNHARVGITNKKIKLSFNCCGLLNAQLMEEK